MTSDVSVWFEELCVGDVTIANTGELGFVYSEAWLRTRDAFPLSLTMPLESKVFPSDVIFPWLAGLLPEEQPLTVLARALGIDRSDSVAVLKEIGGDTAGALSFGVPSRRADWIYTPLTEFYDVDDPEQALERHFDDLARRPFLVGEEGVRLSLAGGQHKSALAVLDRGGAPVLRLPERGDVLAIPRFGAPSTLIVKPDNPVLPGIVENETYCLTLAAAIGIPSAAVTILRAGARRAIGVLRYDRRVSDSGALLRVHQEDFAQANGVAPARKYERGTIRGLNLEALLGTGRHLPPTDALALLDQLIFNILVGNSDAHAKNYSLLLPIGSGPRLAPLYDVSSALPWPHIVQYFAQNIAGGKRKPSDVDARHWDAIAAIIGYGVADLRKRVRDLVDGMVGARVGVTKAVADLSGSAGGYVEQAASLVEQNALRIAGRLR